MRIMTGLHYRITLLPMLSLGVRTNAHFCVEQIGYVAYNIVLRRTRPQKSVALNSCANLFGPEMSINTAIPDIQPDTHQDQLANTIHVADCYSAGA